MKKEKAVCIASIIKNLKDIDMDSECGKLLLMGLAKITTESQTNKTPQEVLDQLNDLREEVFGIPKENSNKGRQQMTDEEVLNKIRIEHQITDAIFTAERNVWCTVKVVHNDIQQAMELVGSILNKLKIPFATVNDFLITGMHNILTEHVRWKFEVCDVHEGDHRNAINGTSEQEAKHVHEYYDREYEIYSPHFKIDF